MKKQPKKKVYVIMVSRTYPATHPRKGQETNFPAAIISEDKRHTCRGNYALWYKKSLEVQAGRAVISLRYWSGKPYASKQVEFCVLYWIHVQKVHVYQIPNLICENGGVPVALINSNHTLIFIEDSIIPLKRPELFAAHDGLSMADFNAWFKKPVEDAAILHFTQFSYPVIK